LALPVFEVRATKPTWTQRPSTSQRMRTASFRPKPRSETATSAPGPPLPGMTLIRGAMVNAEKTATVPETART